MSPSDEALEKTKLISSDGKQQRHRLSGGGLLGRPTGAPDENAPYLDWMWTTQHVSVCQNYSVKMYTCRVDKIFLECVSIYVGMCMIYVSKLKMEGRKY